MLSLKEIYWPQDGRGALRLSHWGTRGIRAKYWSPLKRGESDEFQYITPHCPARYGIVYGHCGGWECPGARASPGPGAAANAAGTGADHRIAHSGRGSAWAWT